MSIFRFTRNSKFGIFNIRGDRESKDIIAVSAKDMFLFENNIKEKVSELVKRGHKVNVVIDGNATDKPINGMERIEYTFEPLELSKLIDLNADLLKCGMSGSIKFNEFYFTEKYTDLKTCWDLDQVVKANAEIDKVVDNIKRLKLSPYETMVYIHKYLTQNYSFGFNTWHRYHRSSEKLRSIVAAIKNKQTVCAGFASMTKAIIDRLNLSQLKCKYQVVVCWKYNGKKELVGRGGGHVLSLITIQDPKYNIDGMYFDDATWDHKTRKTPHGSGYAYFMYPVEDMFRLADGYISVAKMPTRVYSYNSGARYVEKDTLPLEYEKCEPIPYEAFEKAVKRVYSLEKDFLNNDDVEQAVNRDIEQSLSRVGHDYIDSAINSLLKQYKQLKCANKNLSGTYCKPAEEQSQEATNEETASLVKQYEKIEYANKDLSGTYCKPVEKQSQEATNEMQTA